MSFTKEQMIDAAQYANFSQATKMKYWNSGGTITDNECEKLLLIAYDVANVHAAHKERKSILDYLLEVGDKETAESMAYRWGMKDFIANRGLED